MSRNAIPDAAERAEAAAVTVVDPTADRAEVLGATGLVKRYGRVTAVDGADFSLRAGEILAIIGDNGAGKSSLVKCLSGAVQPDEGEIRLDGKVVSFAGPIEARTAGIEIVHQSLAVSPSLDIASNLFLGRERRKKGVMGSVFRQLDHKGMRREAAKHLDDLGVLTVQNMSQAVETLSGGQRQAVAVARAAAFGSRVVIMDEPTAALGVKESNRVLRLIEDVRDKGMPVVLISHNMPHVFEVADRIHVHRLGRRACVVTPQSHSMQDTVAIMTGALPPPEHDAS
ncbi:ATP-binding cassette domain-containing protein [Aquipuribacter hungaricus]|uniref:ATP-binding cassette domain-containing protein n=1 Tax=Aquipuribacter hungaricus TaxID=545624 RepID=A0ABV7WIF2_9MICO